MSFTLLCTFGAAFYVVIWFFDSFFKSCMHYPYYAFLEGTGLKVGFLNFSWSTTAFNRFLYRWSKNLTHVLNKWFGFGYIISIWLLLPFSLWTLISFIYRHFNESIHVSTAPEVKAILPGFNVPASDFWVYFLAMSVSSIFHELGHALTACQHDVQLLSVGISVFAIIPIAFVQLNGDHVAALPVNKRLRIFCAGVWHNLVLAFFALMIFMATPVIFSVGYETDLGVTVVGFTYDSVLKDVRGLDTGDIITSVNNCVIKNSKDWVFCLQMAHERYGICTSAEYVAQNDEILMETIKENDVVECCRHEDIFSYCFEYMEPKVGADSVLPGQYSCLKPRDMVKNTFKKCTEAGGFSCPRGMHCLRPSLNNHTYLMVIERKDNNAVLFLGLPYELHKTVFVDQYFPRAAIFSLFSPTQVEKLLKYIFMLSMGLAFLNIVPCYGTDGSFIAKDLVTILARYLNKRGDYVTFIHVFTIVIGTGITIPILLYLFYQAVFVDKF